MTPAVCQRGESLLLALDALSGDTGTVSSITAKLRKMVDGTFVGDPVGTFAVTSRAASGDIPAGWNLVLADTSTLPVGTYGADAKLVVGSTRIITDPIVVRIVEPATV